MNANTEITKEDLAEYDLTTLILTNVVKSMLDIDFISNLSGLPKEKIIKISLCHDSLSKKYAKGGEN